MSSQVSLRKAKGINTNTEKAQWRQQKEMQPQAKAAYNQPEAGRSMDSLQEPTEGKQHCWDHGF